MTKERRLAIEQWKEILRVAQSTYYSEDTFSQKLLYDTKEKFCKEHDLDWEHNCWLCQYVRRDYKLNSCSSGCEKCPIYKLEVQQGNISRENPDECGCGFLGGRGVYDSVCRGDENAIKKIIELLGGK